MGRKRKGYLQLLVYIHEAVHRAFKMMAVEQGFNMGEWLANKAEEAVIDAGYYKPKLITDYKNFAELIKEHRQTILDRSRISAEKLDQIAETNYCEDIDLLRIAIALDVSEEEIRVIANTPSTTRT